MSIAEQTTYMDATAQAEAVQKGDVSASELLEAAIERVEKLNPELNAVVTTMYDEARAAIAAGLPEGPFTGVPFLLKDLTARYAGVPMKCGCKMLKDFVPREDTELVTRFKRSGVVIFGKTNTPEFGFAPTTESELYGPCKNPWDTSRIPGGSSGGSASAIASGMVAMAHGNDGGGSIRIPAACCGLFGLKPTRARNSLAPAMGDANGGLACEHVLTRSVRDSATMLDATEGYVSGDPYCAPPKARPFIDEVGADPGKLRIAFTVDSPNDRDVHADCKQAVRDAASLCEELGHTVVEAAPDYDGQSMARAFSTKWLAGAVQSLDAAAGLHKRKPTEDDMEPMSWGFYEKGLKIGGADYLKAADFLQRVARRIARFMEDFDVLLTPTTGEPPLKLGELGPKPGKPLAGFYRSADFVPFTAVFNTTGVPAMSVPLHWNDAGLPIGSHFVGRFGDEATLFRLAAQLEEARPWADRRPTICA